MKQKIRRWSNKCADSQVKDMLKEICTEIKLKNIPEIRIIEDAAASPFTTGMVRNIIILPNGNLNKTDLKYVLKHEAVHCKNKDILWKSFFLAVNIVHWFNPFVWLLRKFAEQDMEIACDEEVVMKTSMEKLMQ